MRACVRVRSFSPKVRIPATAVLDCAAPPDGWDHQHRRWVFGPRAYGRSRPRPQGHRPMPNQDRFALPSRAQASSSCIDGMVHSWSWKLCSDYSGTVHFPCMARVQGLVPVAGCFPTQVQVTGEATYLAGCAQVCRPQQQSQSPVPPTSSPQPSQ